MQHPNRKGISAGQRRLIWLVLALWLGAMAASALALMAEPTGDGFVRGMNRVTGFLAWQLGAAVLALVAWIGARDAPKGALLHWLARVPGWWCVAFLAGFGTLVAVAVFWSATPQPAAMTPPTAPVDQP